MPKLNLNRNTSTFKIIVLISLLGNITALLVAPEYLRHIAIQTGEQVPPLAMPALIVSCGMAWLVLFILWRNKDKDQKKALADLAGK